MEIIGLIIGYIIGALLCLGAYKIYNLIKYHYRKKKNKKFSVLK